MALATKYTTTVINAIQHAVDQHMHGYNTLSDMIAACAMVDVTIVCVKGDAFVEFETLMHHTGHTDEWGIPITETRDFYATILLCSY